MKKIDPSLGKIVDEQRDTYCPGSYHARYEHPELAKLNLGRTLVSQYRIEISNTVRSQDGTIKLSRSEALWGWSSPGGFCADSPTPEAALENLFKWLRALKLNKLREKLDNVEQDARAFREKLEADYPKQYKSTGEYTRLISTLDTFISYGFWSRHLEDDEEDE